MNKYITIRKDFDSVFDVFSKTQTALLGPFTEQEAEKELEELIKDGKKEFLENGYDVEDIKVIKVEKGNQDSYGATVYVDSADYFYYIITEAVIEKRSDSE